MIDARVEVDKASARRVARALEKIGEAVENARIGEKAGEKIEDRAKASAPRRTGALAASHRTVLTATGAEVIAGGGSIDYAAVNHFGRRVRAPYAGTPWLFEAADDAEGDVVDEVEGVIARLL